MLYKLIVNKDQLRIIKTALETYARLGTGQIEVIISDLGFYKYDQFKHVIHEFHSPDVVDAIGTIKHNLFNLGYTSSHSISNNKINKDFKVSFDLYNSVRNRIISDDADNTIESPSDLRVSENGSIQIESCTKREEKKYAEVKKEN